MSRLVFILLFLLLFSSGTVDAFSLPMSHSREQFQAEECPSNVRQAIKAAKRDASKFSIQYPSGTLSSFMSTRKNKVRKCSALMKKTYFETVRNAIAKKPKNKRLITPRSSLAKKTR
jgi:hypothetical protein